MTILRQKMIEDMQLRGLAGNTQRVYISMIRQLAKYYGKSPDKISEEELRQYFLYLKNTKGITLGTYGVAMGAIKFLYRHTLRRSWPVLDLVRPVKNKPLPVVLSPNEVLQILACLDLMHYKVCLSTIYACGLRVSEAVNLSRQQPDGDLHRSEQGRQKPLCAAAAADPGNPESLLVQPSASGLVVSAI